MKTQKETKYMLLKFFKLWKVRSFVRSTMGGVVDLINKGVMNVTYQKELFRQKFVLTCWRNVVM